MLNKQLEHGKRKQEFNSKSYCSFNSHIMVVYEQDYHKLYLSNRTAVPIIVPANWIKMPAEIKIGTAKPISSVASLSGFGKRVGLRVASSKPSGWSSIQAQLE